MLMIFFSDQKPERSEAGRVESSRVNRTCFANTSPGEREGEWGGVGGVLPYLTVSVWRSYASLAVVKHTRDSLSLY